MPKIYYFASINVSEKNRGSVFKYDIFITKANQGKTKTKIACQIKKVLRVRSSIKLEILTISELS